IKQEDLLNSSKIYSYMLNKLELLKIDLMAHGMGVSERAKQDLTQDGKIPLSLFEYATTSGIPLRIQDSDIYVNSPFAEDFCKGANWQLDSRDREFFIVKGGEEQRVEPVSLPSYFNTRWSQFAMSHTDRVRISPIAGCSFSCEFCDLSRTPEYQKKSVENLIESVRVALNDPVLPARHVLISGGNPKPQDESYMDEVYERVTKAFDVPVDIMMVTRRDVSYVDKLYSWGVNELSVNLELFNPQIADRMIVGKNKIGREGYFRFLERAVEVYGRNKVRSILLVGLEPLEDTLRGVEALAQRGVSPVLSPFRPSPKTPLAHLSPPTAQQLAEVYEKSREIAEKHKVKLGPSCIPCHHNTLTFPDGSDFYKYS
ncbi:MAG: radical SAM protein, partial [Patescibacteria group bacterium]